MVVCKIGRPIRIGSKVAYGARRRNSAETMIGVVDDFEVDTRGRTWVRILSMRMAKAHREPKDLVVYE